MLAPFLASESTKTFHLETENPKFCATLDSSAIGLDLPHSDFEMAVQQPLKKLVQQDFLVPNRRQLKLMPETWIPATKIVRFDWSAVFGWRCLHHFTVSHVSFEVSCTRIGTNLHQHLAQETSFWSVSPHKDWQTKNKVQNRTDYRKIT